MSILGEVTVDAPGTPPGARRSFYTEIIVYLATVGARGATAAELEAAIWPGGRITASSRRVALTVVRRWLGQTRSGPWLPPALPDRRYRMASGSLFDWELFQRLRARGQQRGADGGEDLRHALDLVRGVPLLHADVAHHVSRRSPYRWLTAYDLQPHRLAAQILDTAHRLAATALGTGDNHTARWAIERASTTCAKLWPHQPTGGGSTGEAP